MKIKEAKKVGSNFTYAEFLLVSQEKSELFRRDEAKFNEMGIASTVFVSFEQKLAELKALPSDLVMECVKIKATELKNETAETLRQGVKKLTILAKCVYPVGSNDLKPYLIEAPSKLNNAALAYQVDILAGLSKANIHDFVSVNLTEEYCDDLIAKKELFLKQQIDICNKINLRDKATENRWTKANEIYSEMAHLLEVGKFIWETESEAYYNDYILYPTSTSSNSTDDSTDVIEDDTSEIVEQTDING